MPKYAKLAFLAKEQNSHSRLIQVCENQEDLVRGPIEVFLVGENPALLAALQANGRAVSQVATRIELPADVFVWFGHEGFWATVNRETGRIRNVGFAEDSLQADTILLSDYAPGYREQFTVKPVEVTIVPDPQP